MFNCSISHNLLICVKNNFDILHKKGYFMSKILLLVLIMILSACSTEHTDSQNHTSIKTNTSQSLNATEKETRDFMDATKQVRLYTPSKEGHNLQGLNIYFDTCQSDAFGSKHKNCDYAVRINKKFEHCPIAIRDGDCDPEDKEYSYPLGFLDSDIYIDNIAYVVTLPTYYAIILTDESKKCSSLLMLPPRDETVDAGEAKDYEDLKPLLKYSDICDFGLTS
jgi:hypothetical protein